MVTHSLKQQIRYYTIEDIKQLQKIAYYKPKIKRICLIVGITLIGLCIVTPFTNLLIPLIVREVIHR